MYGILQPQIGATRLTRIYTRASHAATLYAVGDGAWASCPAKLTCTRKASCPRQMGEADQKPLASPNGRS